MSSLASRNVSPAATTKQTRTFIFKDVTECPKMNDHPAVRLVQYPGEGHGNRKMPGRRDACLRMLQWYDWYVKDGKPIDGPMPAYDISDQYGLELPDEEE